MPNKKYNKYRNVVRKDIITYMFPNFIDKAS